MIQIIVQAQKASCRKSSGERITTGMVGKRIFFDFSADWGGLVKTAVFEGSGTAKDVVLSGDEARIPHECLTVPGGMLRVGVFGTDGTMQTPTIYTDIGQIERGADPSGEESADPTLPIWAKLQAMMGDLGNLTTTAKENLVAAINEAAKTGGGTAADVKMQVAGGYIQYSTDGGASWSNLIAMADLIGPAGADGKDGQDGAPGADGQDGITPTIGPNGNWYLGNTDTGKPSRGENGPAGSDGKDATVDRTLTQAGQAADAAVVGQKFSELSEEIVTTSESKVAAHNTGTDTHSDIRLLIQGLTDRLNALVDSDDTTLDQLSEVVSYIKSNRSLIEAITTSKVSVADIVDNLTTNVTNKPLSAAQGVALKALIDAITVPDKLPNPNALTFTGAVTGSYDGSAPLSVDIPSGGGSGGGTLEQILDFTTTEEAAYIYHEFEPAITVKELLILIYAKSPSSLANTGATIVSARLNVTDPTSQWYPGGVALANLSKMLIAGVTRVGFYRIENFADGAIVTATSQETTTFAGVPTIVSSDISTISNIRVDTQGWANNFAAGSRIRIYGVMAHEN